MKYSVYKSLFEKIDIKKNVQAYYDENMYKCETALQKSSIELWLKDMFRIDIQNENQIKIMYKLKQFRINVQRDENNVWIKTIQYMCVLIINDLLRINVWLVRMKNWKVIGEKA